MLGNPVSCRGHNHITYKYRLKGDSFIFIKLTQTSNSSADSLLRFVVLGLVFFRGCFKLPADRQTVMFNVDALQSWTFGTTCSYGLCIELSAHQWDSVGMFPRLWPCCEAPVMLTRFIKAVIHGFDPLLTFGWRPSYISDYIIETKLLHMSNM